MHNDLATPVDRSDFLVPFQDYHVIRSKRTHLAGALLDGGELHLGRLAHDQVLGREPGKGVGLLEWREIKDQKLEIKDQSENSKIREKNNFTYFFRKSWLEPKCEFKLRRLFMFHSRRL